MRPRTRCALLAALVAAGGVLVSPVRADEPRLVLTGDRSASIDLTLTEPAEARLVGGDDLEASIGGTYAGFAIQSLPARKVLIGGLRVPALEGSGNALPAYPFNPRYPAVPMPLTNARYSEVATLAPGTYRFTLLTDGPASVRVPLTGLAESITVSPQDPAQTTGAIVDLDVAPGAPGVPIGTGSIGLSVAADTLAVVAAAAAAQAGQAMFAASCVRSAAGTGTCDTNGFVFGSPGSVHTRIIDDHQYEPGALPAVQPVAEFRTASAGVTTFRRGFAFTWRTRP